MKFYYFFFLIILFLNTKAQSVKQINNFSKVTIKTEIIQRDSQFFLKPVLLINLSKGKIKIPEKYLYVDGVSSRGTPFAKFYLRKRMLNTFTFITLNKSEYNLYDNEMKFKFVGNNFRLKDEINLQEYYPLEIGEYMIILEMDYFFNGKRYTAQAEPTFFNVNHVPKNSLY